MPAFPKPTATETDPVASPTAAAALALADTKVPKSLIDAKGDLIVGSADDTPIRKAVGTDGQLLSADAASGGGVKWIDSPAPSDASTSTKGVSKLSVAPVSASAPIAVGDNDPRLDGQWRVPIGLFGTSSSRVGTWTWTAATAVAGGYYWNSTGAVNDETAWNVVIGAGTWTFSFMHGKLNNAGIIDVQIDGASVGTIDLYAASTTFNNVTDITGITVASTGKKTLKLKMSAKNASSSAYYCLLQSLILQRTA